MTVPQNSARSGKRSAAPKAKSRPAAASSPAQNARPAKPDDLNAQQREMLAAGNTVVKIAYAPASEIPDPHVDLEGWARATLADMREKTLVGIALLKDEVAGAGSAEGDEADRSSARMENETRLRAAAVLSTRLQEIDAAIRRLERGEYGICESTGEEIPVVRLKANPLATYTLEAQERRERAAKLHAPHREAA